MCVCDRGREKWWVRVCDKECVCVCVCLCVRKCTCAVTVRCEREGERERERERMASFHARPLSSWYLSSVCFVF